MRNFTALKFNRPSAGANATKIVGSLVAGAAVGMAIGTLFAPETGAATRRKIAERSNDMLASVKDEIRNLVRTVKREADNTKDKIAEYKDEYKSNTNPGSASNAATTADDTNRYDTEFMG